MSFTVEIRTDYVEVDAFYYSEYWENHFTSKEDKVFFTQCCEVDPNNREAVESVVSQIKERELAEGLCLAMLPDYARITVDDEEIENEFTELEMPEDHALIKNALRENDPKLRLSKVLDKFLYFKVWENTGWFKYEGDGEFNKSKLTYCLRTGRFEYDGESFDLTDGDGNSSYEVFYRGRDRQYV